jgi:hypothetical protein
MTPIRYDRLLRLYPTAVRDEMLEVLAENGRPARHEVVPLLVGGLRARCGGHRSLAGRWLYACRAAAVMLLVYSAAPYLSALERFPVLAATGLAVAAVMIGRARVAAALALAALVLAHYPSAGADINGFVLAVVLLLIPGRPTAVRSPLPILVPLAAASGPSWLIFAALAVVVLWSVIDELILLALGMAFSTVAVSTAQRLTYSQNDPWLLLDVIARQAGIIAIFLTVGGLLAWHRARV